MSAGLFSNISCQTSPYIMKEDLSRNNPIEKQGMIFSSDFNSSHKILLTHNNNIISPSLSIRRTFSADMSSPTWLQNNGFPLKKVQSSHQLQALGKEDYHDSNNDHDHNKGPAFEDIWSSIQADKRSWGSILSPITKNHGPGSGSDSGPLPPPYVHPSAKRSASLLSEKSLEICTESLGSETGSDGFSYSSSEPEESDKEHKHEHEEEKEKQQEVVEVKGYSFSNASEMGNCKYNSNSSSYRGPTSKRSMMVPPSFPPPLPSLANRDDGSNFHIRSLRQDGRLVVEAFSVPSQNCFRAQRQDGRLLLTLAATHDHVQDQDEVFNDDGDDEVVFNEEDVDKGEDEEQGEAKTGIVIKDYDHEVEVEEVDDNGSEEVTREVTNVQRTCPTLTMVSKLLKKSTWRRNYNTTVIKTLNDEDEEIDVEEAEVTLSQTLLPPHSTKLSTATAALNAYEYYWRRNSNPAAAAVAMLNHSLARQQNNKIYADATQVGKDTKGNNKQLLFAAHNTKGVALAQEEVVLVKAAGRRGEATSTEEKGEYLVPFMLRGCKDHKRSFFLLDPYCIAT